MAFGAGILGPKLPGTANSGDNCEDGALGNFITGSPSASGDCPNTDAVSGVYANKDGGDTLICTIGPAFALGQVQEADLQYFHGNLNISVRNITGGNPGVWISTGSFDIASYIDGDVQFNEGVIGADSDTTGLVGPATSPLFPWAHATLTSYTHHGHAGTSAFFDDSPFWDAIPVSSYPNGNTGDAADLAPNGMHMGNGGLLEGQPVS
jgi:hypothetical protein